MSKRDAMIWRRMLQWQAVACAEAGLMIQASVWAMGADMCRAAFWTECFGEMEAERLVGLHCQGE